MDFLVDVNIAVFNHAPFLEKTLNSILSQKANFPFRLLIGDDCSTDGSIEILKEFEKKTPDKIKVIYQDKNLGLNSTERNGVILLKNSQAKYIALIDGDDYWTDENKLQKQVDFLEANPKYVGCFHNTEERYDDDDNKESFLYCKFPFQKISFTDLSYRNLIPTCSVVYKNNLFEFPDWFYKLKMGDWPLHLLNAQYGDFWYIPKVMAVHRLHSKSMWMLQDPQKNNNYVIEAYDTMIKGFEYNKVLMDQMIKGKVAFIDSISKTKSEPTFKQKVKYFLKGMIDKL